MLISIYYSFENSKAEKDREKRMISIICSFEYLVKNVKQVHCIRSHWAMAIDSVTMKTILNRSYNNNQKV